MREKPSPSPLPSSETSSQPPTSNLQLSPETNLQSPPAEQPPPAPSTSPDSNSQEPIIATFSNITTYGWQRLAKIYQKSCHFHNFDTIRITADDCRALQEHLPFSKYTLEQLFEQPALTNFTVILTDDEGRKFYSCFRPTKLPATIHLQQKQGSSKIQITPRVDMYVSLSKGDTTDCVFVVGSGLDGNNIESLFVAPLCARPAYENDIPVEAIAISNLYPLLQIAMFERPNVFATDEEHVIAMPTIQHRKTSKGPKPHKTKVIRTIHIDKGKVKQRTHVYTCPKWNVAGYYRTNKNGTRFFVRGHTRGRDRNKQDVHCKPKEYQLVLPDSEIPTESPERPTDK